MSELISQSPYKLGENGHSEYTWSNNIDYLYGEKGRAT